MKKLTKLLVLSGLALSLLTGCANNGGNGGNGGNETPEVVKTLQSLQISAQPTKVSYYQGEQFDGAGLEVKAVYNTGAEVLAAGSYTLSGFDSSIAGPKTIVVTFEGKSAFFNVNVIGRNGLSIDSQPSKIYYVVGEELDLSGLVVAQLYADQSKVILTADDYEVSGFSSAEVGPTAVTITSANGEAAVINMYVFAADWSAGEKADMAQYLLYDIPYYRGMAFDLGGLMAAGIYWFEAETAQPCTEEAIDDYADMIEAIKVPGTTQKAWSLYTEGLTDDVDYLGFAADSDVLQYARWSNDNPAYFEFEILSIGLTPADKLLVSVARCAIPLAGYGVGDGSGWHCKGESEGVPYDMVEELLDVFTYGAMFTWGPTGYSELPFADIKFPAYDADTYVFIDGEAFMNPYIYGNEYSQYYDTTVYKFSFQNKEEAKYFSQETVDGIRDAYIADLGEDAIIYPSPRDGSFSVELEQDGFVFGITYSYDYLYHCVDMEFEVLDYEMPFTAPYIASTLLDEVTGAAYFDIDFVAGELVPLSDVDLKDLISYYPAYDIAMLGIFNMLESWDDAIGDVLNSIVENEYLTAKEAAALKWEYGYGTTGSFKVDDGEAADINISYDPDHSAANIIAGLFSIGNVSYSLQFFLDDDTLAITPSGGDAIVFPARLDAEEGDYTGTWTVTVGTDPDTVTYTVVIDAELSVVSASTYFYAEDDNHNCSEVMVNLQLVNLGPGMDVFYLQIMVEDGVKVSYESWEDARVVIQGFLEDEFGPGADEIPETLSVLDIDRAEGAYNFVLNNQEQGLDIYFDSTSALEDSDIGVCLRAAGFEKAPFSINGMEFYLSENDQYYLAVYTNPEDAKCLCIRMAPAEINMGGGYYVDFFMFYYYMLFLGEIEDEFNLVPDVDLTNVIAVNGEAVEEESAYLEFVYDTKENAAAALTGVLAEIVLAGYELDEGAESETKGMYVAANGDYIEVVAEEGSDTIRLNFYHPAPAAVPQP